MHSQSRMIATISRSGAVVARWAHNPKVVSSSLASATTQRLFLSKRQPFLFFHALAPHLAIQQTAHRMQLFFMPISLKKKPFGGPSGYQILIFFLHAHIYIMRCKKKIRYARLLRKNKGICVKISLPVPINFVARRFKFCCPFGYIRIAHSEKFCCPWFFTPTGNEIHAHHHGLSCRRPRAQPRP